MNKRILNLAVVVPYLFAIIMVTAFLDSVIGWLAFVGALLVAFYFAGIRKARYRRPPL